MPPDHTSPCPTCLGTPLQAQPDINPPDNKLNSLPNSAQLGQTPRTGYTFAPVTLSPTWSHSAYKLTTLPQAYLSSEAVASQRGRISTTPSLFKSTTSALLLAADLLLQPLLPQLHYQAALLSATATLVSGLPKQLIQLSLRLQPDHPVVIKAGGDGGAEAARRGLLCQRASMACLLPLSLARMLSRLAAYLIRSPLWRRQQQQQVEDACCKAEVAEGGGDVCHGSSISSGSSSSSRHCSRPLGGQPEGGGTRLAGAGNGANRAARVRARSVGLVMAALQTALSRTRVAAAKVAYQV